MCVCIYLFIYMCLCVFSYLFIYLFIVCVTSPKLHIFGQKEYKKGNIIKCY